MSQNEAASLGCCAQAVRRRRGGVFQLLFAWLRMYCGLTDFFQIFVKYVGLSNILDSELIRREPAEGSHWQVVGAAVMDGKLLGKVVK